MTIYISLPITGYDENERREKCKAVRKMLMSKYGKETFVMSPFEIADALGRKQQDAPSYGTYLGADIRYILDEADAVCIVWEDGYWLNSKGVRLEEAAARLYNKKIIFTRI